MYKFCVFCIKEVLEALQVHHMGIEKLIIASSKDNCLQQFS